MRFWAFFRLLASAMILIMGSVLDGLLGWFIGYALWSTLGGLFTSYVPGCSPENIDYVEKLYHDNAFLAIFGAAFSPIPYKVFTISAGVFDVPLGVLILASTLGRFGRFYAVAACIFCFGPGVKRLMDKYFEIATLLLFVLVIAGFLALKWLL